MCLRVGKPFIREEIFETLAQLLNVEFEYEESIDHRPAEQRSLGLDISSITLPEEQLNAIKAATQAGRVTKVHELLDTLKNESLITKNLWQHLKHLTNELDLDSVYGIVDKIKSEETTDDLI